MRFGQRIKRGIDVIAAALGLLVLSPVLASVAVLIRFRLGRPVFFRQPRIGFQERRFAVLKFRTMRDDVDENGRLLPDEVRLTAFGRFLRRTSLDELPQLWNVLLGDMSLVGPRPLLPIYLVRYSERQRRRHLVPPGITGWAQINGRNAISWEQRFELDLWYVENWSLLLDFRILLLTLGRVLHAHGMSHPDHVTMPEFMGTSPTANITEPRLKTG